MMSKLYIKSDFTDYYDILHDENDVVVYNRFINDCKQRGTALKYLRSLGIKTLELKQVNQFYREDGLIVIYTNPKEHHSNGKILTTVDEAMKYHSNYIASKYYENTNTIKYLQIGKKRYTLTYEKDSISLNVNKLIDIKRLPDEHNKLIGMPIFSIDYISNGLEMIATDFNEVENLSRLGFNHILKAEDVVNEIREALILYGKVEV